MRRASELYNVPKTGEPVLFCTSFGRNAPQDVIQANADPRLKPQDLEPALEGEVEALVGRKAERVARSTKSSVSFTIEYGRPERQLKTPSSNHFGLGTYGR
jgi:hypothetical protein